MNLRAAGTLHATKTKTDIDHVQNHRQRWLIEHTKRAIIQAEWI